MSVVACGCDGATLAYYCTACATHLCDHIRTLIVQGVPVARLPVRGAEPTDAPIPERLVSLTRLVFASPWPGSMLAVWWLALYEAQTLDTPLQPLRVVWISGN